MRHPHERIVFAMDVPHADDAIELSEKLKGRVGVLKVGLELFISSGPRLLEKLRPHFNIFLDLKLHDIPTTVERAAAVCGRLGVKWLTVHTDAGPSALAKAVEKGPDILAVTRLTSNAKGFGLNRDLRKRAKMANEVGCAGIICPPHALSPLADIMGNMLAVTPGISMDSNRRDHSKIFSPRDAIGMGADYIVVGRAIRDAEDPAAAAMAVAEQVALGEADLLRRVRKGK